MKTEFLIDIIYYTICAIIFIVTFTISVVQRAKQKNISKLQALYECIPNAVIKAESIFGKGNGERKKHLVMTELINIALQTKTKYDYAELDKHVEDVVKATKNVNVAIESVDETFCESVEQAEESTSVVETPVESVKTDGAIVIQNN